MGIVSQGGERLSGQSQEQRGPPRREEGHKTPAVPRDREKQATSPPVRGLIPPSTRTAP